MTRRTVYSSLALFAFCLGALGGCAEDAGSASELLLRLSSDLVPGAELQFVRVDTLDTEGPQAVYSRWLTVLPACPAAPPASYNLGSLSISRGQRELSRIRVVGFRQAEARAVQVVEHRVDARFQRGTVGLEIMLSRACRDAVACDGDTTCDPALGQCRGVERIEQTRPAPSSEPVGDCLAALAEPPEVEPGAGPDSRCAGADSCPPCEGPDCPLAVGKPCRPNGTSCVSGASCVDGFCCEQACEGECLRCDLAERAGRCVSLLEAAPQGPLSEPDLREECASSNLRAECASGVCQLLCSSGYANCDAIPGCEAVLGTPERCKSCGDVCTYGYCAPTGCEWHHTSDLRTDGSAPLEPGRIYTTFFARNNVDTKLRALGALVYPAIPGRRIRLALYEANASFLPLTLVAQTEELEVLDNAQSKLSVLADVLRVEGLTRAEDIPLSKTYFIAIQVSDQTQLYGAPSTAAPWLTVAHEYGPFPELFPALPEPVSLINFTLYAITTPG